MNTALNSVSNFNIPKSCEAEMAFVYKTLAPDLLLFTLGLSLAFGFLVYIF